MVIDLSKIKIFLKPGATDMRKAINGLSGMVRNELGEDPFSGNLFLFLSRSRDNMKALYWDRNGYCLWQKRLEKHKFPWPNNDSKCWSLTKDELLMLLRGIDFFNVHTELKYGSNSAG